MRSARSLPVYAQFRAIYVFSQQRGLLKRWKIDCKVRIERKMRTRHPNTRRKSTAPADSAGKRKLRRDAEILLVEDERFVREAACEILRAAGHRVVQARGPAEAKRVFSRHGRSIRLLISDVVMPGQDGRALAQEIEALRPGLRKIFISGYPENMVVPAGSGAFYVSKPFSLEFLVRKVSETLLEVKVPGRPRRGRP